ncbi:MAG: hypothetical protein IKT08_08535 [Bacteroidales bacterium]|nr:hypothetical protein [Bacteroidales bacterium]
MITCYHGSPELFKKFDLSKAGDGTGIKFGFGVYLTESEASAVHYSQPRYQPLAPNHYLYSVEIPELTDDNHIVSAKPVNPSIIKRTEATLGKPVPQEKAMIGKEFRKWLGLTLVGGKKVNLESEKAAAAFLDSIGVFCNVWPQAQSKPDGLKNYAVFDENKVVVKKIEHIEVFFKEKKYLLVENSRGVVKTRCKDKRSKIETNCC